MSDSYKIELLKAPKGIKLNDHIKSIYLNDEPELAKDKIFRLTYKFGLDQVKLMADQVSLEEGIGSMSEAFMKTFNNFVPTGNNVSFINYYKKAIHSQIICDQLGKYRYSEELINIFNEVKCAMRSLDEPTKSKDDDTRTRGDIIPSSFDIHEEVYYSMLVKRIFDIADEHLSRQDKRKDPKLNNVFIDYLNGHVYGGNTSYEYLAEKYSLTEGQVRVFICRQRKKLKLKLIEEGYYE